MTNGYRLILQNRLGDVWCLGGQVTVAYPKEDYPNGFSRSSAVLNMFKIERLL